MEGPWREKLDSETRWRRMSRALQRGKHLMSGSELTMAEFDTSSKILKEFTSKIEKSIKK